MLSADVHATVTHRQVQLSGVISEDCQDPEWCWQALRLLQG